MSHDKVAAVFSHIDGAVEHSYPVTSQRWPQATTQGHITRSGHNFLWPRYEFRGRILRKSILFEEKWKEAGGLEFRICDPLWKRAIKCVVPEEMLGEAMRLVPAARRAIKNGSFIILTSALTLTETLWMCDGPKLGEDKVRLLNRFFRCSFLRVMNVDRAIAESAQKLAWDSDIKPKDAIHVATALRYQCSVLEIFDKPLIAKSGLVDGLEIREPQRIAQSSCDLPSP